MSKSKRILSFVMAFAMVMTMFSGVGAIFAPKAAARPAAAPAKPAAPSFVPEDIDTPVAAAAKPAKPADMTDIDEIFKIFGR